MSYFNEARGLCIAGLVTAYTIQSSTNCNVDKVCLFILIYFNILRNSLHIIYKTLVLILCSNWKGLNVRLKFFRLYATNKILFLDSELNLVSKNTGIKIT